MFAAEQLPLIDLPPVPAEARLEPLIKFPGGKRWLVPFVRAGVRTKLLARDGLRYIEPFAGGLAVGLFIGWPSTIACDLSPDLIGLYRAVQRSAGAVADMSCVVCCLFAGQDEAKKPDGGYYGARRTYNDLMWSAHASNKAALLLYLNKRGYNGLLRVNAAGRFNVPQGKSSSGEWYGAPEPVEEARLASFAEATRGWTWVCGDFGSVIAEAREGDVCFCDPPYAEPDRERRTAKMFTGYVAGGFTERDQVRLADALAAARDRGVVVIHTNADSVAIRTLYRDRAFWMLPTAELRAVNRDGEGRRRKPCLIVCSHPEVLATPYEEVNDEG